MLSSFWAVLAQRSSVSNEQSIDLLTIHLIPVIAQTYRKLPKDGLMLVLFLSLAGIWRWRLEFKEQGKREDRREIGIERMGW